VVRELKVRADATVISVTYFYRPFQGSAANAWPYQVLRAARLHLLPPALQARCLIEHNLSDEYCKNFAQAKNK
jgi:hypothetical protein